MATVWKPTGNAWWIWLIPIATIIAVGTGIVLLALEMPTAAGPGALGLSRRSELLQTGAFFLVSSVFSLLVFLNLRKRARRADRLETEGIPAVARILSVEETGTTVNNLPECRFRLEVTCGVRRPVEVEMVSCVSLLHLGNIVAGRRFRASVDPSDESSMAVDFGHPIP
ncbi:MAG: hypothetical protein AVO35_11040 [Candidatus Aegiribacteria sp. MLS_C]|nr:MAG: hypothetical protein AVO35_11040 [Candidatus Aegiribacteria sp. MLS_C]